MSGAKLVIRYNEADEECTDTLQTKSDLLRKIHKLMKNIVSSRFDEFRGTILLI